MTIYLTTATLLLAVLMPEPCTAAIKLGLTQNDCPKPEPGECRWGMKSTTHYASITSNEFGVNFLCDTETDGGGWIIIQRRVNHDTLFNRTWKTYRNGFGQGCHDYWLGNLYIHRITTSGKYELRIDMVYKNTQHFAHYQDFFIDDEDNNFALHLGHFLNSSVKDDFHYQQGQQFSTRDRDNDAFPGGQCANLYDAGWWYANCHTSNLNGHFDAASTFGKSVIWYSMTGHRDTLSAVEMKIRKHDD
ncbi:hypothetical protein Btru_020607 [Bulinus truncatus]|nr:hypothetical protein Btru_020607 [Bulinus truncatus]